MAVVLTLHDAFPLQCRIQVLARFHAYAVQLCQGIESVFLDEAQKVFQQIDVILPELRRILGVISSTARGVDSIFRYSTGMPRSLNGTTTLTGVRSMFLLDRSDRQFLYLTLIA